MKDVRSWFVDIAATHRASSGWALAAMLSSRPQSPPAPPSRCCRWPATGLRLMAVGSGRSVLRAANPGRPDMEATHADETTIRAVVVFVGRAMRAAGWCAE